MADTTITDSTAATAIALADLLGIVQGGTPKKGTFQLIQDLLGVSKRRLDTDHAISATTATEVTDLQVAGLVAGTYVWKDYLLAQSATATVSPMFGVNFTGTAAVRKMTLRYVGTGTAASTGVADDVVAAPLATGNVYEGQIVEAFTTTAPNMGAIAGVGAINQNILYIIEGLMIVTATGDLELWHSSETATSTTLKVGSSRVVTRTA